MVTRLRTSVEYVAQAMLMGPEWNYGHMSHAFFKGNPTMMVGLSDWTDADTMEPLTQEQVKQRRLESYKALEKETRTHATGKDEG